MYGKKKKERRETNQGLKTLLRLEPNLRCCSAAAVPNPVAAAIALLKLSSRCFEG